jgi:arylsulfatase A-like enzyme
MFGDRTLERLDKALPSIGTIFKAAGYQTGYVGKWHLSPQEPPGDIADYGIDFFSPLPEFRSKQYPFKFAKQYNRNAAIAGLCEPNPLWSGKMSKEASAFIDRCCQKGAPFLLFYSDYRPHPPYFLPSQDFEKYAPNKVELWPNLHDTLKGKPMTHRRLRQIIREGVEPSDAFWSGVIQHYAATVSATDHQIGLVYEALERNNLVENTIVVFVSDHGDTCGAHGFWSKGVIAYEELIRIPMIISWPGHFQTDGMCDRLVSLMDILPTLADATGTEFNRRQMDGQSLVPFLQGQAPRDWRQHVLIMHHGNMYGLCTMRAVVGMRYKYVHYPYDTGELYDRSTDPWEMRNLIDDPGHKQESLAFTERLKELMEEASDTKVKIV